METGDIIKQNRRPLRSKGNISTKISKYDNEYKEKYQERKSISELLKIILGEDK